MNKKRILALLLALLTVLSLIPAPMTHAATLKKGSSGTQVTQLQRNLAGLGYLTDAADGKYGAKTREAVKKFQADFGLTADGIAADATQSAVRNAVVRLQVELKAAGYAPGTADGQFGSKTKTALEKYQKDHDLKKTGCADSATWASINQETSGLKVDSALRRGSSGKQVKYLQKSLIGLGYLGGTADGVYGGKTYEAVRAYQKAAGLSVDGSAGKKTLTSLKNTVVALQSDLTNKGYNCNGADGIYGSGTKAAVKSYQKAAGLTADGVAGAATMKKLYGVAPAVEDQKETKIQIDPLYQDTDFSKIWYNNRTKSTTVKTSGCAGVSVAMALNALLDTNKYTGQSVMQWYADNGYYKGSGTYHDGLLKYPRVLGLTTTLCAKKSEVIKHMTKDRLAAVLIKDRTGRAEFTYAGGGGHYILLSGYRYQDGEDQVYVNNPLSYKRSGWFDLDDVMANAIIRSDFSPFVIIYK